MSLTRPCDRDARASLAMHVQYAPSAEDTRCLEAGVVAAYWRDHSERSCKRQEPSQGAALLGC